ncbi:hypothetical protein [Nocardia fluminea]|uniref:hypothetical protein n=1 Tax=Nocardia fluminea TaxID=134984 RepID=UPI0036477908
MATDPTPQLWSVGPCLIDPTRLDPTERTTWWVIAQIVEADDTVMFEQTAPTQFDITTTEGDTFTLTITQHEGDSDEPAQSDLGPQRLPDRAGAAHP